MAVSWAGRGRLPSRQGLPRSRTSQSSCRQVLNDCRYSKYAIKSGESRGQRGCERRMSVGDECRLYENPYTEGSTIADSQLQAGGRAPPGNPSHPCSSRGTLCVGRDSATSCRGGARYERSHSDDCPPVQKWHRLLKKLPSDVLLSYTWLDASVRYRANAVTNAIRVHEPKDDFSQHATALETP